jgi:hypothetical protein
MRDGFERTELIKIIYKNSVFAIQKTQLLSVAVKFRGFELHSTDRDSILTLAG